MADQVHRPTWVLVAIGLNLADDLRYTGRGVTTVEEHDLWHMPIVLLLILGLLSAEWGYRRVVGLP